jgi:hypothetical protein
LAESHASRLDHQGNIQLPNLPAVNAQGLQGLSAPARRLVPKTQEPLPFGRLGARHHLGLTNVVPALGLIPVVDGFKTTVDQLRNARILAAAT